MKRASLLMALAAACGDETPPPVVVPFPVADSIPVQAARDAGFAEAERVRFVEYEFGEIAYVVERMEVVETDGKPKKEYHPIGRIRMRPGFDAAEAEGRHRRYREELEQVSATDAPGNRLLRDRSAPGREAFLYTEDTPAALDIMKRQKIATIAFLWDRYEVVVSAFGGSDAAVDDLTGRVGKLSRWIERQFEEHPRPAP